MHIRATHLLAMFAGFAAVFGCSDGTNTPAPAADPSVAVAADAASNGTVTELESFDAETLMSRIRAKDALDMSADGSGVALPAATLQDPALVVLADETEAAASGKTVVVTVRARSVAPSGRMGVAYFTNEVGNSGTREFDVTSDYADYAFDYDVPAMVEGRRDVLRIGSDLDGDGQGVDIASIRVGVK